jgi:hypothetical protein
MEDYLSHPEQYTRHEATSMRRNASTIHSAIPHMTSAEIDVKMTNFSLHNMLIGVLAFFISSTYILSRLNREQVPVRLQGILGEEDTLVDPYKYTFIELSHYAFTFVPSTDEETKKYAQYVRVLVDRLHQYLVLSTAAYMISTAGLMFIQVRTSPPAYIFFSQLNSIVVLFLACLLLGLVIIMFNTESDQEAVVGKVKSGFLIFGALSSIYASVANFLQ